MASYSRQIPPGGEGNVTVKVNTSGYGGRKLSKKITVHTNQTNKPHLNLRVSGMVETFAKITPRYLKLAGVAGNTIEASTTIVPTDKYPFRIVSARARDGKHIEYQLDDFASSSGRGYILKVTNTKVTQGSYSDQIFLKTDSSIQPEIKISLYGHIKRSQ